MTVKMYEVIFLVLVLMNFVNMWLNKKYLQKDACGMSYLYNVLIYLDSIM